MDNYEIADVFDQIARLMEIKGENPYKIMAYQRASQILRDSSLEFASLSSQELTEISGIGKALAEKILELNDTGNLAFLEKLEKEVPPSLIELLEVPGLGAKRISLIWKELGITTLLELYEAAKSGELHHLPGIGSTTEQRIMTGIETLRHSRKLNNMNIN